MEPAKLPPVATPEKAREYLDKLIGHINQRIYQVTHSDLNKFEVFGMVDHYRIDLGSYFAEISHSKNPNSGKDIYVLIFTNIEKIRQGSKEAILAYLPLTQEDFEHFRQAANRYFEQLRQEEELARFKQAMKPIDHILEHPESISKNTPPSQSQDPPSTQPSQDQLKSDQDDHPNENKSNFFHDF